MEIESRIFLTSFRHNDRFIWTPQSNTIMMKEFDLAKIKDGRTEFDFTEIKDHPSWNVLFKIVEDYVQMNTKMDMSRQSTSLSETPFIQRNYRYLCKYKRYKNQYKKYKKYKNLGEIFNCNNKSSCRDCKLSIKSQR